MDPLPLSLRGDLWLPPKPRTQTMHDSQRDMTLPNHMTASTIDALALGRQTMLVRANEILGAGDGDARRDEAVPALAGLLMSSLEELKVAEEELREQNAALTERRAMDERRTQYYRQMFQYIP